MVSPVTPNSAVSMPANPVALDFERPAIPDPARTVTATAEVLNTDSSTTDRPQAKQNESKSLEQALSEINSSLEAWSTGLKFEMDTEAQRMVVSIIDNDTGEVIRTVPSDAVIRVAKMIVQLQGHSIQTTA